jgi:hypothetical protein
MVNGGVMDITNSTRMHSYGMHGENDRRHFYRSMHSYGMRGENDGRRFYQSMHSYGMHRENDGRHFYRSMHSYGMHGENDRRHFYRSMHSYGMPIGAINYAWMRIYGMCPSERNQSRRDCRSVESEGEERIRHSIGMPPHKHKEQRNPNNNND